MPDNTYGLDPVLLKYGVEADHTEQRLDRIGAVGLGSPRQFDFFSGGSLADTWAIGVAPKGWTVTRFEERQVNVSGVFAGDGASTLDLAISDDFTLESGISNFISFRLRVNETALPCRIKLELAAGVTLVLNHNTGADSAFYYNALTADPAPMGTSAVQPDGYWRDILLAVSAMGVQLWEDGKSVFTVSENTRDAGARLPGQASGNAVRATFNLSVLDGSQAVSVDLADVAVLTSTARRLRAPAPSPTEWVDRWKDDFGVLRQHIDSVLAAGATLVEGLKILSPILGPTNLFRGVSPGPDMVAAAANFSTDPRVTAFAQAVRDARDRQSSIPGTMHYPQTVYLGIGATAIWVAGGGYDIGFLFGLGESPISIALVMDMKGSLGAAFGASTVATLGISPLKVSDILGWGQSVHVDGGEGLVGAMGLAGNIPLHFIEKDNCGGFLSVGFGVGEIVEASADISYSWALYNFLHQENPLEIVFDLPTLNHDWANFDSWTGHPPYQVVGASTSRSDTQAYWGGGGGNGSLQVTNPNADGKATITMSPRPDADFKLSFIGTYFSKKTDSSGRKLAFSVGCDLPFP